MAKRKRDQEATTGRSIVTTNGHTSKSKKQDGASGTHDTSISNNGVATQSPIDGQHKKNGKLSKIQNSTTLKNPTLPKTTLSHKVAKTNQHLDVKTASPTIQIIAGSYERVLHGITVDVQLDEDVFTAKYADAFLFNAHTSAIKCLALSPLPEDSSQGIYLATGGSDERVNVYSLSASPVPDADSKGRKVPTMPSLGPNQISENPMNRELGTLVQHTSGVSALHFPSRSKLLSGSEDNTISITRIRDLNVISTVKAPNPKAPGQASGDSTAISIIPAGVNDFAIHPSMKLMVSVGKGEKCMRLWNLVTGKKAGVLNFDRKLLQAVKESKYSHGEGRKIRWNATGTEFAVSFERGVVIFGQDSVAKCILLPQPLTKVHQITYFSTNSGTELFAISTEDGRIVFYNTQNYDDASKPEEDLVASLVPVAYTGGKAMSITNRVKDFQILNLSKHDFDGQLIAVGCSDGAVKLVAVKDTELTGSSNVDRPIGRMCADLYQTGSRITCLEAFVMLPPLDIEGGLSEAESLLDGGMDSEDSSEEEI